MKLSVSNIAWDEKSDEEMYSWLSVNGIDAVEIAPTRIIQTEPYEHISQIKAFADRIKKDYGLEVSSMQSIWYGRNEKIFGEASERDFLTEYTKKAIDFAEAASCSNLVFGCPKNRNINDYDSDIDTARAFFSELGEYAAEHNTVLAMEANPVIYNTNFINTTVQAVKIVKEVNSSGFKINLDFGTVIENNEGLSVIEDNIELINHVHISEPYLAEIQPREEHKRLKKILNGRYNGYVSLEMKNLNNLDLLKKCILYMTEVFYG